jgi:2-polyprenyl-6-hydroxyphenyl methylase/3-demethylubiquinone-9 3-methyltransferase
MTAFSFGENWLDYSRLLDASRLQEAQESLQRLVDRDRLDGLSMLDVGCGSGLFAIAAVKLGASRVVAIDCDANSVAATQRNVETLLEPPLRNRVDVRHEDILSSPEDHDRYDLVYAWGSLHHTGAMWRAVVNATNRCVPGGQVILAIYNRTWLSPAWLRIKRFYNRSPAAVRVVMVTAMTVVRAAVRAAQLKRPLSSDRGMSVWYDAVDWLGGLPYECATHDEVCAFMATSGGQLVRSFSTTRSGCNEFVFRRSAITF